MPELPNDPIVDFPSLQRYLDRLPAEEGTAGHICGQTGGPYTEIFARRYCRPGDEWLAEREVALEMLDKVNKVAMTAPRHGIIYWRKRLETETTNAPQIIEYREDGPDKDFTTDRRCVKDHNWRSVGAYCRFTVGAPHAEPAL